MSRSHNLSVLNCSSNFEYTDDLIELALTAKYCDSDTDLGVIYVKRMADNHYLLVDGKRRVLSVILLLKTILDLYSALAEEDSSVLLNQAYLDCQKIFSIFKIRLFGLEQTVFNKIINKEPMSYNEKQTEIYRTCSLLKNNIENSDVTLDELYELVQKLKVNVVFINETSDKDIFCTLNSNLRPLNQILLIKSYLAELNHAEFVNDLYFIFGYKEEVFVSFFKAYLSPKFNRVISDNNKIYSYFVKYINLIKKYQDFASISNSILKTAKIYNKMYHADFMDPEIRNMFIKIISNDGRDTFSYLLELCEDFQNKYLSKETFLEVCNIIYTYVWERKKKPSIINESINFSQMVEELNKVIYNDMALPNDDESNNSN